MKKNGGRQNPSPNATSQNLHGPAQLFVEKANKSAKQVNTKYTFPIPKTPIYIMETRSVNEHTSSSSSSYRCTEQSATPGSPPASGADRNIPPRRRSAAPALETGTG